MASLTPRTKTALVIGASRGIGASIAQALSASGYSLFLASKTLPDLVALSKTLDNTAVPIQCDVRSQSDIAAMIKVIYTPPDLVVYNAGAIFHGSWVETSVKKYKLLHEVIIILIV
jgi:short-subunit dehydrogenase